MPVDTSETQAPATAAAIESPVARIGHQLPIGAPPKARSRPRRIKLGGAVAYPLLFSYLVLVLYPMFWLFYTSLKKDQDIFLRPFALPKPGEFQWSNFARAWVGGHFGDYFFNSVLLTSTTVVVTTFLAAM